MSATITETDRWVARTRPNPGAAVRMFCFPYAGGGATIYRTWPEGLPDHVEVAPIQLPGRISRLREPPFGSLPPLVDALTEVILPLADKPFCFFGHSMGAIISFELARRLRRERGVEPFRLFVSGRRAPQIPSTEEATYNLSDAEFMEELRRLNGTPREVLDNPELMELMLPLLRADFSICQTYTYTPDAPLDCPITAFGGLREEKVERHQLEAWREQTTSDFVLRMLPGDHFFIHSSQPTLLRIISQELLQHRP